MENKKNAETSIIGRIFKWIVLIGFSIFFLYPLIYTLSVSLSSKREHYKVILWPLDPTIANYIEAIQRSKIHLLYKNSIIVTGVTVILVLIISSLAAYAFARKSFFGSNFFFYLFFIALIVPLVSVYTPLLIQLKNYRLLNTYFALIFPYTTISVPFAILILRNFFKTIPKEITDAARIDGCNDFQIFLRIILPLSKSALSAVTIFTSVAWWNEYLMAATFINDTNLQTIPAGIGRMISSYFLDYTIVASAVMIGLLPLLVVYLIMQKNFIKGVTAGAIK